jgi:serine/threonine protein kinase
MKAEQKKSSDTEVDIVSGPLDVGAAVLGGSYKIAGVITKSATTITYAGKDARGKAVSILEYFPADKVSRQKSGVVVDGESRKAEFDRGLKAFVESGQKLMGLKHRGIASVRTVEEAAGTAYIVSDLPEGQRLSDFLRENGPKIRPPAIAAALESVLEALAYAHEMGVLHRNILPSSIIVVSEHDAVLTDFHVGPDSDGGGPAWASDSAYVPPELLGAAADVTPASDLYSLAATFYHVIVRRPPADARIRSAAIQDGKPDPYWPLWKPAIAYRPGFRMGIDLAMCMDMDVRLQSVEQWQRTIAEVQTTDARADESDATRSDDSASKLIEAIVAESAKAGKAAAAAMPDPSIPAEPRPEVDVPVGAMRILPPEPKPDAAVEASKKAEVAPPKARASSGPGMALMLGGGLLALAVVGGGLMLMGGSDDPGTPTVAAAEPAPSETIQAEAPAADTAALDPALVERLATPFTPSAETADVAAGTADTSGDTAPAEVSGMDPALVERLATPSQPPAEETEVAAVAETPSVEAVTPVEPEPAPAEVAPPVTEEAPVTAVAPVEPEPAPAATVETPPEVVVEAAPVSETPVAEPEVAAAVPAITPEPTVAEPAAAAASSAVLSALSVDLGFVPANGDGVVIGTLTNNAAPWMQPGQRIVIANGIMVATPRDLVKAIRETNDLSMGGTAKVTFAVQGADGTPVGQQTADLPVVLDVALLSGLRFQTHLVNGTEVSEVTVVPEGSGSTLEVGDVLLGYVPTQEKIGTDISLIDLLVREVEKGTTTFSLAVVRDGKTWLAAFDYTHGAD